MTQTLEFYKGKKDKISKTETKTEIKVKTEAEIKAEAEIEADAEAERMSVQSAYEEFVYRNLSEAVRDCNDVYTSFVDFVSKNLEVYLDFDL